MTDQVPTCPECGTSSLGSSGRNYWCQGWCEPFAKEDAVWREPYEWADREPTRGLAKAEAAPSTTDPREQERCPNCLAARLTPLPDERGAAWACTECHGRHDAVLPSQAEAARQAGHAPDTEREAALPRCRGCLSTALYPVPERAPLACRWACLDCGERFDTALPSELETRRGEATSAEKARIGEVMRE